MKTVLQAREEENAMQSQKVLQTRKKEKNIFSDKQKLKRVYPYLTALQKILKGILQVEIKGC
jgi:hypothetical protein